MIMKKKNKISLAILKYTLEVPIFYDDKGEFNFTKQKEKADKEIRDALKDFQEKGGNRFEPISIELEEIDVKLLYE